MQFDRVRWARKWRQMKLNLTREVLAPIQVDFLQRCGELDLADVTLGGKKRGIGETEEEGQCCGWSRTRRKFAKPKTLTK